MVHDTVSSVTATSRRMALRYFVPGVAAPIIPIPWNVPAPSSVLNVHPMECSSSIQCSECPSHGMFQHHLVLWPGDPRCCRWTESSRLDGCRPALFLDRVQQIVKERFDPTVRWRKLGLCKCSTRYLEPVRWCSATPSPVWRGEMRTFGLAACNRALNYPEKLFWLQVLSSPATTTTKNSKTKSEGHM